MTLGGFFVGHLPPSSTDAHADWWPGLGQRKELVSAPFLRCHASSISSPYFYIVMCLGKVSSPVKKSSCWSMNQFVSDAIKAMWLCKHHPIPWETYRFWRWKLPSALETRASNACNCPSWQSCFRNHPFSMAQTCVRMKALGNEWVWCLALVFSVPETMGVCFG